MGASWLQLGGSWGYLGSNLGGLGGHLGDLIRNIEISWFGRRQEAEGTPGVEGKMSRFGLGGSRGIAI